MPGNYVLAINEIEKDHLPMVGHFSVGLSELIKNGIPIPRGFVVNVSAYEKFKSENNLDIKTNHLINTIDFGDSNSVKQISAVIKKHFIDSHFPKDVASEIYSSYKKLGGVLRESKISMSVSPVMSHSKKTHFFENIKGETNLMEKIKECWAANFDENYLLVGFTNNSSHSSAILIQKLVDPDVSGKIFTSNPFENVKNSMVVTAMYGFYEARANLISMPDIYTVNKSSIAIESKEISNQLKMTKEKHHLRKLVAVSQRLRNKQKITDKEILELAEIGKKIEKIYFFPQEIDWSLQKKQIYLTHIRPITHVHRSHVD